ncbi:MAG: hypothetical protein CL758_05380 [Chloroflexi bacterium]|nr:hypothetical protein [Chloroflexota bacterium]|tara:strand:- start:2330 stop:3340 length:1011 start_codon:yes stop_codon:yes gene_type:complete
MFNKIHPNLDYRESDRDFWNKEFENFVPDKIFDCHIHMFNKEALYHKYQPECQMPNADFKLIQRYHNQVFPNRKVNSLFLGFPYAGTDTSKHNDFMFEETLGDSYSVKNRLTTPDCTLDDIKNDINRGFVGLKVYRIYSVTGDIANCRIHEFLTHEQMELANDLGLWVTLHMSRSDGCGDEENLKDLEEYTNKKYPNIKWILAHCARSFTYEPIRKAIDRLKAMPNIYYDLSAVTDVRPFITLFQKENLNRIFYGSDGIDSSSFHGTYGAFGTSWQSIDLDKIDVHFKHTSNRPVIALYEQLLSIKHAAEIAQLGKTDIDKIFWSNASREFNIGFN